VQPRRRRGDHPGHLARRRAVPDRAPRTAEATRNSTPGPHHLAYHDRRALFGYGLRIMAIAVPPRGSAPRRCLRHKAPRSMWRRSRTSA
jgi:hypothetical protein